MNAAIRPYATAGVALVGASVIAISPLAPPMPDVQALQRSVSSASVELSAAVNPIENWVQVFQKSAANLGAIGQQIAASPAPILKQIVENQLASLKALQTAYTNDAANLKLIFESVPGAIETARGQLQSGDIVGAFDTINNTVVIPLALNLVTIVSDSTVPLVNTVNNFAKAFATLPNTVFQVVLPMTFPLVSTINAAVQATQDVYDGVVARDPGAVLNTLVNLPANLVDGFLNGSGTILGFLPAPGLLTPYSPDFGFLASGPIASLIQLRDVIAQAIGATPPTTAAISAAAKVPAAATTVTLSTAPQAQGAESARGATKAASDSATDDTAVADATESSTGGTGSTKASAKATPAVTAAAATDSATGGSESSSDTKAGSSTGGNDSKAGSGKKASSGKSGRPAKAGK